MCSVYCKGKITAINAYQCLLQRIQGREVIKGRLDERYKKRKQRQKKGGGEGGEEINLVSYVHRGFVKWTFMWTGTGTASAIMAPQHAVCKGLSERKAQ